VINKYTMLLMIRQYEMWIYNKKKAIYSIMI